MPWILLVVVGAMLAWLPACDARRTEGRGPARDPGLKTYATAWSPGDDIPGWEDYACPDLGQQENEIVLSYPGHKRVFVLLTPEMTAGVPPTFDIEVYDCAEYDCEGGGEAYVAPTAHVELYRYVLSDDRGQGWYMNGDHDSATFVYDGRLSAVTVAHLTDTDMGPRSVHGVRFATCLSRVRPDELRGAVFVSSPHFHNGYYGTYSYSFSFEIEFDQHGGYSSSGDPSCTWDCGPRDSQAGVYYGDERYEDAWPWDEITDPAIRDTVFDMYYPCANP